MTDETHRHQRLAEWFEEASSLDGAALDVFLEARRAEDAPLHAELCELLEHDTRGSAELDSGIGERLAAEAAAALASPVGELAPGEDVGPYSIQGPLGSGGFALVYAARQREPVTRDVALKVLRPGMDSVEVLARFAAELQAQARMNHEHVARVFDAGTADGRPYLAMELVEGEPITRWCAQQRLGLRARLALFVQACEAVQHAHQKGVLHRDLKPSNVLVTAGGTSGHVKIIDFGIAKAIEGSLTDDTLRTRAGQLVGTPEYMSPEQAGRADDLDTRTDVYSLGVLLYELITGARPFDFAGRSLYEIQRAVHEEEPPRPSERIAPDRLGGTIDGAWERALRSDLDWVALRALEKDPAARYGAAAGLAADVRRFLDDQPVEASPPSRVQRATKFVRRNRAAVVAASLVAVSLAGGMTWALVERGRAVSARVEAVARAEEFERVSYFQQRQLAGLDAPSVGARIRQLVLDEARAAYARAGSDEAAIAEGLGALEEALRGANFTNVATATVDGTFLSALTETIADEYRDEPRIAARLLYGVTFAQNDLGLSSAAAATGERALEAALSAFGPDHVDTHRARIALADARFRAGDFERADRDYATVVEALDRADLGRGPLEGSDRAAETERVEALRGRAMVARLTGDDALSLALRREAFESAQDRLGPDAETTLIAKADLASETLDPERREALQREVLGDMRARYGRDAARALTAEENLASFLAELGRTREASEIRERTLPRLRAARGDLHHTTLRSIESLGLMKHFAADFAGAEPLIREAYDGRVAAYGPDAIETLGTASNLAMVLGHLRKDDEAIELYERIVPAMRAALGVEHEDTLGAWTNLAQCYNRVERFADAAAALEKSLAVKRRVLGLEHTFTQVAMEELAAAYRGVGRGKDAYALEAEYLECIVEIARRPDATARVLGNAAERVLTTGYRSLRDVPVGLELAERAVRLEEAEGGALLYLHLSRVGLAHWYAGDMDRAIPAQRRALKTAPEHERARMEQLLGTYVDRQAAEAEADTQ